MRPGTQDSASPRTLYNQVRPSQFCQLPVTTSGKKKEENWSEQFLLKVYIMYIVVFLLKVYIYHVYSYMLLFLEYIVYIELTSFAMQFACRKLCLLLTTWVKQSGWLKIRSGCDI